MRFFDPFHEMDALRREIDRVLTDYSHTGPSRSVSFLPGTSARAYPLLNMSEDRDHVYVQGLAPGIDPATLDVSVHRNTLTITGAKPGPAGVPAEAFHRNERAAGRFVRSLDLPAEVDNTKVQARYEQGLLSITLPKAEAAKPRQIQVAVS
jgi:HSP20 family protein